MKLGPNTIMSVLMILHFFTSFVFAQAQESLNVRVVSILPEEGITGLVIRDGYIYASSWYGLEIIDVRNPQNPVKVGHYAIDDTVALRGDPRISGKYAYISQIRRREGGVAGMLILDISDPTQPRKVAFYPVKGEIGITLFVPNQISNIEVAGDYVYLVDDLEWAPPPGNRGAVLRAIDVHDPSHPIEISTIKRNRSFGMQFVKNYLYITHWWSNTLEILDVSNPSELRVVTSISFPVGGFFPTGDKLYITRMIPVSRGSAQEYLTVADISDAAHPKVVSDIYIPPGPTFNYDEPGSVFFYGKYIYYYEASAPIIHVILSMDERLIEVGFYKKFFSLMSSVGPYIYATTVSELYILEFMESNVVSIQPKGKLSSTWGKLKRDFGGGKS